MPLYEYRCRHCQALNTAMKRLDESAAPVACAACGGVAERIVSRPSVHRDKASKLGRLDPKYDRMVDRAMANTQHAEPDRVLDRVESRSKR
jgi:putative FmdB family regulatory protein